MVKKMLKSEGAQFLWKIHFAQMWAKMAQKYGILLLFFFFFFFFFFSKLFIPKNNVE